MRDKKIIRRQTDSNLIFPPNRQLDGLKLNEETFAVKIIRSSDEEYQQVALKEFWMLKKLNHPGIVKVHDAFKNPSKGTIYIVMELI